MSVVVGLVVAIVCLCIGAVASVVAARRGLLPLGHAREPLPAAASAPPPLTADSVPFSSSIDVVARGIGVLLGDGAGLTLVAIYAGQGKDDALGALLRAREGDAVESLPDRVPSTILERLAGPSVLARRDLASGVPLGLEGEAPSSSPVAVIPWRGPFGWCGLLVARVARDEPARAFALLDPALGGVADRLGVLCEHHRVVREAEEALAVAETRADDLERRYAKVQAAFATRPMDLPAEIVPPPPPPEPVIQFVEDVPPEPLIELHVDEKAVPAAPPVTRRLEGAERRVAEMLVAPRAEADVIDATVVLLFDGLGADRCYAVEMGSLRPRPIERERLAPGAASARGLDPGQAFVDAVRANARDDFGAVLLTGEYAGTMLPSEARERLGPRSQLSVPIMDRGRPVAVFVAEREGSDEGWSDEEVAFAERLVARAAAARAALERFESLARQVGHAREEQEQMEGALRQLQAVVTALPDALLGVDSEGKITFANRAAGRLLGVAEFDLIGRWLGEVAVELGSNAETWERVLAASMTERHTASLKRAGAIATVDVTVVPSPAQGVFDRLVSLSERAVGVA